MTKNAHNEIKVSFQLLSLLGEVCIVVQANYAFCTFILQISLFLSPLPLFHGNFSPV